MMYLENALTIRLAVAFTTFKMKLWVHSTFIGFHSNTFNYFLQAIICVVSSISAAPITPNEVALRIVAVSKSRPELLSAAVSQADPDLLRVALTHADPDLLEVALTKSQANLLGTALTSGVRAELLRTALTEARPDTLEAALTKADPDLLKVALTESVPELLATALKVTKGDSLLPIISLNAVRMLTSASWPQPSLAESALVFWALP